MKIEQQVTSRELSERLRDLGVKQESYFAWIISKDKNKEDIVQLRRFDIGVINNPLYKICHAYSVAELGELLKEITNKIDCGDVCYEHNFENAKPTIEWGGNGHEEIGDTEAESRGLMLVYLLENKIIKL